MCRLLAVLFLFVFAVWAADFEAVRASIHRQLVETGAPSIAVAVARDGRIVWEEGFGWADREKRVAASEHTMYSLASISKPITATGLMVLVQGGKIDLDRPVNDYLGTAKVRARIGDAQQATVRRVANHTSGLPLHYQFFYADAPHRPPSMDETILRFGNLVTAPSERYQYSNLGFGILDSCIARASGRSYADFMRQEVFVPLGLTRTSVYIGRGLDEFAATRYGGDAAPLPLYEFDHAGASAVYSSAHDLVRFGMFHLKAHLPDQKAILTDESIDAMQRPTARTGEKAGYGVGWATGEMSGYRAVTHTGGMPGVATSLRLVPSERLAIVVLCNAAMTLPHRIADEIMAAVLTGFKAERPATTPPAFRPPAELLGNWKGRIFTYKTEIPMTLQVREAGELQARVGNQMKVLWNDAAWSGGRLTGRIPGDIGIEEGARGPYLLSFSLTLRGNSLNGAVSAVSSSEQRNHGAVTQWVELTKE